MEIHDDVWFSKEWFRELLEQDGHKVGILMPQIVRSTPAHVEDRHAYLTSFRKNETNGFAVPAHPWLLKVDMVKELGYYDPLFSPWEYEDTDYYYFVSALSDWKALLVSQAVVFHAASATWAINPCRKMIDPNTYMAQRYGAEFRYYYFCEARVHPNPEYSLVELESEDRCHAMREVWKDALYDVQTYFKSKPERTWKQWRFWKTQNIFELDYSLKLL